ncbi:MAG: hypothetical protein L3J26_13670 [Candidatus Polarisedimenticolaceae bacterium]|nr:hypothetical protein [Candidatus Polarisedimenticolaceae bacterium]
MKRSVIRDIMVHYRHNRTPGGSCFSTVNLKDRTSYHLVIHVGHLRQAFQDIQKQRPFDIVAAVVLPEHLHMIMALPSGDWNYPGRW